MARLIIIVGLICFVLVELIIRPASALTTNPAAVCVGLDCTVTFGPADDVYEWLAPAGSSKVWVQLEGSQDVVSGARGDFVIASFWSTPERISISVSRDVILYYSILDSTFSSQASGGHIYVHGSTLDVTDPSLVFVDEVNDAFAAFVRHGGAPAGVGHAIVHYKQGAVQSPVPVATPSLTATATPTPTPTPTLTPTPTAEPQPAAVLPSPPTSEPNSSPTSEPSPETTVAANVPVVATVPVVAAPVFEPPQAPVIVESPVLQTPTPEPMASTIEATDEDLASPYFVVPIELAARVTGHQREATFRERVIQAFSVSRELETEDSVAETPAQINAEPSTSAWLATSLEFAAIALGGTGVILGVQSARRRKIAAHRKRFRLITAFS